MSLHVAPRLKQREIALENIGLLVALDSVGVTVANNMVSAGLIYNQPVLGNVTTNYNGSLYVEK